MKGFQDESLRVFEGLTISKSPLGSLLCIGRRPKSVEQVCKEFLSSTCSYTARAFVLVEARKMLDSHPDNRVSVI